MAETKNEFADLLQKLADVMPKPSRSELIWRRIIRVFGYVISSLVIFIVVVGLVILAALFVHLFGKVV